MLRRILQTFRSLIDPLRNAHAADRWIAALPAFDPDAIKDKVVDVVAPVSREKDIRPSRIEAVLKVDARLEGLIAALTGDYTANYDKDTESELRTWQLVFDVIKVFAAAYQSAWRSGHARRDERRWRALLPWVLVRLIHYRGLDGKFRLFRFSHWNAAQWLALHDVYDWARARGWHLEQLVMGGARFSRTGVSVEQQYLKTLLLMRLDSGNFTADQVEWIAAQVEDWAPALALSAQPAPGTDFFVDLSGHQGLRRRDGSYRNRHMLFLDATPLYSRVVEQLHWLPLTEEDAGRSGELPVREQRLLLMRLASLFGPASLAIMPRAERVEVNNEVRVVIGLQALCSAIGDTDPARDALQDDAGIARQVADIGAAIAAAEGFHDKVEGSMWKMEDRSASGCRLTALSKAPALRLGDILAIREEDSWSLGVVRRMQRDDADGLTVGVEIVARRFVRVLLRAWSGEGTTATTDQPFFAMYVPEGSENRRAPQRSLIGPHERMVNGAMADLHTTRGHYLVRFTETVERQPGWVWALFNTVRKLT